MGPTSNKLCAPAPFGEIGRAVSYPTLGPLDNPKKRWVQVLDGTIVDTERPRSALLVSEPISIVCKQTMKTSGRENPNRWTAMRCNRDHGAAGQNRSCSIRRAEKQEKFHSLEWCFFLTSPLYVSDHPCRCQSFDAVN